MPEEAQEEQEITAPLESEALEAGWAARTPAHPRLHAYIVFGAKTDLGRVRENNEDKFDFFEPADPVLLAVKGRVFAVADGMGGHSAGQVAAELALNVFIRSYFSDLNPHVEAGLTRAVQEANAFVVDVARTVPGRNGMGATLTAAVVRDDDLFIAQVGDSRCYLLRNGQLQQLTEDHSWVADQVRAGTMTLEEAEQSPFRNVITRSMGGAPQVEPEVLACKVQPGDRYLLCSDGLSGMVPPAELPELMAHGSPSAAAWNLIERANQFGGKDNITAFVLQVADVQEWPGEPGEDEGQAAAPDETPNGHLAAEATGAAPQVRAGETAGPGTAAATAAAADAAPARGGFLGKLFGR